MRKTFILNPGKLSLNDIKTLNETELEVKLNPDCLPSVDNAVAVIEEMIRQGRIVYGVNTGVGDLANKVLEQDQIEELQRRIVASCAVGTGSLLPDDIVRLILILKINHLACGYSAVRYSVIETMLRFINLGIYPCIPAKGSIGASGDLAPLAHLAVTLMGTGNVRMNGEVLPAKEALRHAGLQPLTLAAKEGLALVNGTEVSTALALSGLFAAESVFAAAIVAGALSVEAAYGSDEPFDPRIHEVRGQIGQILVAGMLRELLQGGERRIKKKRVQDPYSLRCQPQVMGACLDLMGFASQVLEREINAITDNPLVFSDSKLVLSGGNFHAEPVAMAADMVALALSEIGAISERRIAMLTDNSKSNLPPFLVANGGLNSGFMVAHIAAASLASENKSLAHPASVDSLPTVANQEDHVSMATSAARRLMEMAENSATIVGIELMAAAQGVDLCSESVSVSPTLQEVMKSLRKKVSHLENDRSMTSDIDTTTQMILSGYFQTLIKL